MAQLSAEELDEIYSFAVQLGKDAGQLLLDGIRLRQVGTTSKQQAFAEKENAVDIVTQTDEGKSSVNLETSRACLLQWKLRLLCYYLFVSKI
jgi:hypothetical protein